MGPACTPGIALETRPEQYRHWSLSLEPPIAILTLCVAEDAPLAPGYKLKLNSYDRGVDIELAAAVERLRFEHPEIRAVIITAAGGKVFCAGANIPMLAGASHSFKVNFCKFTNETRLAIEDASAHSGQAYIAACNGTTAGGGYELALACTEIYLVDDGNSAVSLPEVPVLGVLPGTGGLTRLVDKRRVRRDLADVFATLAEGIKGRRAVEWRLVDGLIPRSRFLETVRERALKLAARHGGPRGPALKLEPLAPRVTADRIEYRYTVLAVNPEERTAELTVSGPEEDGVVWALRVFREIDDALLRLRFHYDEAGVVLVRTRGDIHAVVAADRELWRRRDEWPVSEIILRIARTLRRMDVTSRSFFAVVDRGSCFAGSLLELALASDRTSMLRDDAGDVRMAASQLNGGLLPMPHGLSRLEARFSAEPSTVKEILAREGPFDTAAAEEAGLVTAAPDEIDWDEELRLAVEERSSLSPDALTGMEANLRFPGPETMQTKIFGRLSAWQNWIFSRPNATGERGALSLYGKPERPQFDRRRT